PGGSGSAGRARAPRSRPRPVPRRLAPRAGSGRDAVSSIGGTCRNRQRTTCAFWRLRPVRSRASLAQVVRRRSLRRVLVSLLALVAVVAAACGTLSPYAAIVNGHRVSERDVDNELKANYDAHPDQFQQACSSHILVDTKEKADAVEARLAKGEDFAAVAKTDSKDPGSAQKGGDVGCFGKDAQLVPEFLQAIFAQP